jgi:signal transduction histidine kinase
VTPPPQPEAAFLAGGGEMGARMRALDWSKTPLGPPAGWPQSLRTAVSMLLPSKAQIILFWGPEYVVFYNDAYRSVFGAKHPQMLGQPGRVAWSEIWDTSANLHALLDGVVRTGEAFAARDMHFTLERHGFTEETYFDVSYDPARIESGEVGGVYCIVTETSARVVGERRMTLLKNLAERNANARTAGDACSLAMETLAAKPQDIAFALVYLDGRLQACTPGAEAALAAAGPDLVKELPVGPGKLVAGLNPQRPFDDQYRSFVELVASQVATAIANAQAYEEERRRAEALAEVDRAKTAFFSNVSHEFRTPLTLMLGPVADGLADAEAPLPPAQRERQELVLRNALRLQKLVNTLLDFSRIEADRAQASYVSTDLAGFTANLSSSFRSAVEKAGLQFTVDCPPLPEAAWIDREMWEKIVLNLLSNALKFTFEGGIAVRLRMAQDFVLEVRDSGTGIPAAELPRVFERFHRVEGAKSRTHEGTGIGLALVRELVRLHGGEVSIESAEGRGSVFTVSIPRGRAHLPQARVGAEGTLASTALGAGVYVEEALGWLPSARAAPQTAAPRTGPRPRIVWADDNADMRAYVRSLLEARYEVEAVADGEAALAAARRRRPDLVLSDVMMPGLGGLGLARALRADPRTRGVPLILLSARAGEEARIEGMDAGADDYLQKPFSARELLARISARLELAGLQAELARVERRKDEFLVTLSHELRNSLAPIRNVVSLLHEPDLGAGLAAEARAILERQVMHLVRLVDELLDIRGFSRPGAAPRPAPPTAAARSVERRPS